MQDIGSDFETLEQAQKVRVMSFYTVKLKALVDEHFVRADCKVEGVQQV